MTTPERHAVKVREAEQALAYRLTHADLTDPEAFAHGYVRALLGAGWRPWAPVTVLPHDNTQPVAPPAELLSETRARLRAARPTREATDA